MGRVACLTRYCSKRAYKDDAHIKTHAKKHTKICARSRARANHEALPFLIDKIPVDFFLSQRDHTSRDIGYIEMAMTMKMERENLVKVGGEV